MAKVPFFSRRTVLRGWFRTGGCRVRWCACVHSAWPACAETGVPPRFTDAGGHRVARMADAGHRNAKNAIRPARTCPSGSGTGASPGALAMPPEPSPAGGQPALASSRAKPPPVPRGPATGVSSRSPSGYRESP
ncbi:hypothetical protein ACCUM_3730 [Candidatus Accumulibacter phosphatis]|uniref:Uncharacterized protein n=1 Tax=Candidatus Accumulibacter phosphatis TaxID=327160 RepID=A0A5S4ENP4_9PROT|nr:hypothetical protein ACCUM_3730 [Candidatus Accumulibacter phosphatis]